MKFVFVTLFPEQIEAAAGHSVLKRALEARPGHGHHCDGMRQPPGLFSGPASFGGRRAFWGRRGDGAETGTGGGSD